MSVRYILMMAIVEPTSIGSVLNAVCVEREPRDIIQTLYAGTDSTKVKGRIDRGKYWCTSVLLGSEIYAVAPFDCATSEGGGPSAQS
jgi:hypothetical protein